MSTVGPAAVSCHGRQNGTNHTHALSVFVVCVRTPLKLPPAPKFLETAFKYTSTYRIYCARRGMCTQKYKMPAQINGRVYTRLGQKEERSAESEPDAPEGFRCETGDDINGTCC